MSEKTGISWCDATFNPWWGCTRVSDGCVHCYAETFSKRMGLDIWGPGKRRFFGDKHWNEPLLWNKKAENEGRRWRVFCASMADVFEIFPGLDEQRSRLWELVESTPYLDWLILTKRPENISTRIPTQCGYVNSNVRIGITIEDQRNYGRISDLLDVWDGPNFISVEPMLGPVDLNSLLPVYPHLDPSLTQQFFMPLKSKSIDWVICGGESGAGCRPMDLSWARSVQWQCEQANIPFFMKQLGGFPDKRHDLTDWPEDLRIQEFPK